MAPCFARALIKTHDHSSYAARHPPKLKIAHLQLVDFGRRRMAEGVGFEPTWRLAPPSRFRVDPVTATSVPLRAGKAVL
jgi:hypothetical protein